MSSPTPPEEPPQGPSNPEPRQEATVQQEPPGASATPTTETFTPATGGRPTFEKLTRGLTDGELSSTGVQKLILEMFFAAERERDEYKTYLPKYYEAERRAGILEERLKADRFNEVMFAVGLGVGCAIIGISPYLGEMKIWYGLLGLGLGVVLAAGFAVARIKFK